MKPPRYWVGNDEGEGYPEPCDTGEWVKYTYFEVVRNENLALRDIVAAKGKRCPMCDKWEIAREYLGLPWKQYPDELKKIFDASEE
jgi:hypothetical protein